MRLKHFLLTTITCLLTGNMQSQTTPTVDAGLRGARIEKTHYGIFFEEINHAGDGGLYAELIRNRNFREGTQFWSAKGSATMTVVSTDLMNAAQQKCLQLTIKANDAGVRNTGYWGMHFEKDKTYRLSPWVKAKDGYAGTLTGTLIK